MSHLGRPKGPDPKLRLDPVAARLSELLGLSVTKLDDCQGAVVEAAVEALQPGEVVLLENVRFPATDDLANPKFKSEDEKNSPQLAQNLARLGDIFVNDAFGTAHRAHSSTEGVTHYLQPAVAGFLMQKELALHGKGPQRTGPPVRGCAGRRESIG